MIEKRLKTPVRIYTLVYSYPTDTSTAKPDSIHWLLPFIVRPWLSQFP